MVVRALKRMVHANVLREVGEIFPWKGGDEIPADLVEEVKTTEAVMGKAKKKSGVSYGESQRSQKAPEDD